MIYEQRTMKKSPKEEKTTESKIIYKLFLVLTDKIC